MNDGTLSFFTLLWALICLAFVLFLAYYFTKVLSKKQKLHGTDKLIKVLDQVSIGQDKALTIIKVADKTMLIGMSSNNISKICDLDSEYCENFIANNPTVPFSEVLKSTFSKHKDDTKDKGDENV